MRFFYALLIFFALTSCQSFSKHIKKTKKIQQEFWTKEELDFRSKLLVENQKKFSSLSTIQRAEIMHRVETECISPDKAVEEFSQ